MSDEDELDNLLSDTETSSDETPSDSDTNEFDAEVTVVEEYSTEIILAEENTMSSDDDSSTYDGEGSAVTQAEVYDNLKRISELEDERQAIQEELKDRTNQLRAMLKHIDRGSILYKMLVSALPGQDHQATTARAPKVTPKATSKSRKAPKKLPAPATKAAPAKKRTVKKKVVKKKARRK